MAVSIGDPGVSLAAAGDWVLVAKKHRRRPKGSGGPRAAGTPKVKVEKGVRFCSYAEEYDIVDNGHHQYTFDNGISSQRIIPKVGRLLSDRELVERHYRCAYSTICAHLRALGWINGALSSDDFFSIPVHHITSFRTLRGPKRDGR